MFFFNLIGCRYYFHLRKHHFTKQMLQFPPHCLGVRGVHVDKEQLPLWLIGDVAAFEIQRKGENSDLF